MSGVYVRRNRRPFRWTWFKWVSEYGTVVWFLGPIIVVDSRNREASCLES